MKGLVSVDVTAAILRAEEEMKVVLALLEHVQEELSQSAQDYRMRDQECAQQRVNEALRVVRIILGRVRGEDS